MTNLKKFCGALKKQLPKELKRIAFPVMIEAQLALNELNALIALHARSEEKLNEKNTQLFQNFLAKRWERIKGTDAAYSHNPDYPRNQACLWLAKQLAPVTKKTHCQLLMPGLEAESVITSENVNDIPLHYFILDDDSSC